MLLSRIKQSEEMEIFLSKENKSLQEKIDNMTEILVLVEKERQQKDSLLEKYKSEVEEQKKHLDQLEEVTNGREVLKQQIEICLKEKNIMKNKLDKARLEIYVLRQYREQAVKCKKKEGTRSYTKKGTKPWDKIWVK